MEALYQESEQVITDTADTFYRFIKELVEKLEIVSTKSQNPEVQNLIKGIIIEMKQEKNNYICRVSESLIALKNFYEIYEQANNEEIMGRQLAPYSTTQLAEIITNFLDFFSQSLSNKIILLQSRVDNIEGAITSLKTCPSTD